MNDIRKEIKSYSQKVRRRSSAAGFLSICLLLFLYAQLFPSGAASPITFSPQRYLEQRFDSVSLCYEGEPVFAAFHSSSCGATEDCGAIWNPLPYLVSVPSPETADTVPGFVSQVELNSLDFRDTVLSAYPWADFTGEESSWVGEISLEDSGRVAWAVLGGVEIPGTEIRSLFSLRSTAFTLEYTGSGFLFTVTGYGHGVGMSQHGANLMAAQGSDYTQILAHYYPGTQLVS